MAGSVNKVTILGNVGKDPEIRTTQVGAKIVNLSVATEESWTDKASGEKKTRTEWHRVVIFNPGLVGVAESYVKKGSKIYLEGALQTRKWTDQQGNDRYSTEIVLAAYNGTLVLLTPRGGDGPATSQERPAERRQEPAKSQWDAPRGGGDLDDEIPFGVPWQ